MIETNELKIFWLRLWEKHSQNLETKVEVVETKSSNFIYRLLKIL